MRSLSRFISGGALVIACSCGSNRTYIAEAVEYEPRIPDGCAIYVGSVAGNDPSMAVKIVLCPASTGVSGWVRFMSRASGWSIRAVEGSTSGDGTLVLRDTRFLENHPTADWRLCLVDQYVLRQTQRGDVSGGYTSSECRDSANIVVQRETR
jgi:hypothetical protein